MPRSDAQKKADAKYHAKTFKAFTVNAKISDYEIINDYCNNNDISKTKFLITAAMYCIDNQIPLDKLNKDWYNIFKIQKRHKA